MIIILEAVLEGLERVAIPDGVLIAEDLEGRFARVLSLEVRLGGVVGDELLTELAHREGAAILEARYELTLRAPEQVLTLLAEIFFVELIHHIQY
jgi:hypothetical protein